MTGMATHRSCSDERHSQYVANGRRMQHEGLTVWIERTWVSNTMWWLGTLRTSVEVKAKRTRSGWDPCWSDEEAHWGQASEEREVGMVVMKA